MRTYPFISNYLQSSGWELANLSARRRQRHQISVDQLQSQHGDSTTWRARTGEKFVSESRQLPLRRNRLVKHSFSHPDHDVRSLSSALKMASPTRST